MKLSSAAFKVLLVDGYDVRAAALQGVTRKVTSPNVPTHGLGDAWKTTSPTGVREADLTQDGAFFDDTTNGIHDAFMAMAQAIRIVCWATAGNIIGKLFTGAEGSYAQDYEVMGQVGNLTKANVHYAVSGQVDDGVILQHQTAKTADWNTKTDGASVDFALDPSQRVVDITSNSAATPSIVTAPNHGLTTNDIVLISGVAGSSADINGEQVATVIDADTFSVPVDATGSGGTGGSFVRSNSSVGGAGYQAISAFSGLTNLVTKIRMSPDDTTYADLITFATVTGAPTAERKAVTGVIDRFLCVDGNVTGTGSVTPFVGFARNRS